MVLQLAKLTNPASRGRLHAAGLARLLEKKARLHFLTAFALTIPASVSNSQAEVYWSSRKHSTCCYLVQADRCCPTRSQMGYLGIGTEAAGQDHVALSESELDS
jgi:hypothetical protein